MKRGITIFAIKLLLTFISALCFFNSCKDKAKESEQETTASIPKTPILNYAVTNIFPHDTSSFTEGLLVHNGQVFESTGSPEEIPETKSQIGIDNLATGKFSKKIEIDRAKYFGEGIVFFKDKLYQLTYKNKVGFIYDANSFKPLGKFSYSNPEGWSLTTNGTELIMSDGSEYLTFLNPKNLKPVKTLRVIENGMPVINLNELEYIKGFIYANVWLTNYIAKVDPSSGKVVAKLDLNSVTTEAKNKNRKAEVLNGIAYDSTSDKIYVTGKLWANIYQIDFAH